MRRPPGATILALVLGWLGIAGILNALVWQLARNSELMTSAPAEFVERFPPGSWWLSLLALASGATALSAARALWRSAPSAVVWYLAWAATVLLAMVTLSASMPSASRVATVVILVPVLALLAGGWLLTRRLVQPVRHMRSNKRR